MNTFCSSLRCRSLRRGQTLVEYALILAIISIVAVGVLMNLGTQVKTIYSNINTNIAVSQSSH